MLLIRKLFVVVLLLSVFPTAAIAADWEAEYGRLLKKYVTPAGVRYSEWKANPTDMKGLESVVEGISKAPAVGGKGADQLAFHLNAYNAWILHEVLEKYPTKSVKDPLYTFFTGPRTVVAGEKMSFNHLEKDVIRPRFNEPRMHFALNCASRSCPPLLNEPYDGAKLEGQLEQQTRSFINSPKGVTPTKDGAQLSKIFEWYKEDFQSTGGVLGFVNKRLAKPLPSTAKISYQEYDWALNEAK